MSMSKFAHFSYKKYKRNSYSFIMPESFPVWVGNIPSQVNDFDLSLIFSRCGEIHSTRIVSPVEMPARYGFVNFTTAEAQRLALTECKFLKMRGKQLVLNNSTAKSSSNGFLVAVRPLPSGVSPEEIGRVFSVFGQIKSVRIYYEGQPREFGSIKFAEESGQK
ncbi:hypothetical protein MHBO_003083, partial [Bonamia ostreae]